MRGDGVGVGDIGEVPGDARSAGDTAGDDDGGGAGRERDAGVVGGRGGLERDASTEPSGDRVGVGDGARGEHGACDGHGAGSGGAHGMRGDGVGVGDIGEVPGDARGAGDTAGDDDGGGAGRERDAGVVGGRGGLSVMRRQNRAGTGSASVTVHGASMGLVTHTGRAREGHTGCEATEWESETSVRCLVTHGARGTRRVTMTVGERGGSVTQGWSVDVGA
jgi:hypothetical protein